MNSSNSNCIPKILHYCWFGGKEKPKEVKKCIESWKFHLSDYEIMEWNEENFDIDCMQYSKEAYEEKKYAFVSDVARIKALYEIGGFYLDTDVEVLKSFDDLVNNEAVLGFEECNFIATSFMGFKKEHRVVKEFIDMYKGINFKNSDGSNNQLTNVKRLTDLMISKGIKQENNYQEIENIKIYEKEFFSPYDYINGKYYITNNTYCIHHFHVTWLPKREQLKKRIKYNISKIFGVNFIIRMRKILNKGL